MARKKKSRKKQLTIKDPETLEFFGIILLVLSVLLLGSLFFNGNVFDFFRKALGWGVAIISIVFLFVGLRLIGMNGKYNTTQVIVSLGVFLFSFLGWIHLFVPADQAELLASQGQYGGNLGLAIRRIFEDIFGVAGSFIILTPIATLSLLFALYIKPKSFFEFIEKILKGLWIVINSIIEFLKRFAGSKNSNNKNVDLKANKFQSEPKISIKSLLKGESKDEFEIKPLKMIPDISGKKYDEYKSERDGGLVKKEAPSSMSMTQAAIINQSLEPHESEAGIMYPNWKLPPVSLLNETKKQAIDSVAMTQKAARAIVETLDSFGISAKVSGYSQGPTVTQYWLEIPAGIKLTKITNLSRDLSLALAAKNDLRIEPIPGTSYIGIEIPNEIPQTVYLRELLEQTDLTKYVLPTVLGKDISGKPVIKDLASMPHVLVAGATGMGKSVLVNVMITSLLYRYSPDELKFIMVDPKMVEMSQYNGIPHLKTPVITDMDKVVNALKWALVEMENRYKIFTESNVKKLADYNYKNPTTKLPYIVIIIDEMADLMLTHGVDVENSIVRLTQKARATGIHLLLATQRPSVDVITGLIKANVPARMALAVSTAIDSRVILDQPGADMLIGRGDLLCKTTEETKPIRIQVPFLKDEESENVIEFIRQQAPNVQYDETVTEALEVEEDSKKMKNLPGKTDDLFEDSVRIIINAQRGSASLLQTKLNIGYNRAARLISLMEEQGVLSPAEGNKPRKVLIRDADAFLSGADATPDDQQ